MIQQILGLLDMWHNFGKYNIIIIIVLVKPHKEEKLLKSNN